jgi:protein-glutamine gamma-glutamyltransferase
MTGTTTSQPTRAGRTLALSALLLATLLNLHHLAWWCLPALGAAALWHWIAALRGVPLPGRWPRLALTALFAVGVLATFRTFNGLEAGATLLAAMTGAKLLESRALRDWLVLLAATTFLLMAACLDRQQAWLVPGYAACLWLCLAALRGMDTGPQRRVAELLRGAGRQLLLALPLALLLFLFFPRLAGGFWALPRGDEAITGLGDEMTPGSIGHLAVSGEPTLRVRFEGDPPPPQERYFRGPVLHDFDGETWRRHRGPLGGATPLDYAGTEYRYTVTVEPGSLPVVPALEYSMPLALPFVRYSDDYQVILPVPLSQARSFDLRSFPAARSSAALSGYARRIDLALPAGRNPRTLALAAQLRSQAPDDASYARAVLELLRTGGFVYTLEPQLLGRDSIDDLLFRTRQGYCGHYASAFVTLMRAGGVPARVVTGYLGGEWNPIGGYLQVRASEAHAWAEAWLPGRGWTRIDPTAMVSPERLTRGSYDFNLGGGGGGGSGVVRNTPWLGQVLQAWDAANAWWQDKVIGFNAARQLDFTRWLGLGELDWQRLGVVLGGGLALWLAVLAWTLRRALRAARPDDMARGWLAVERRLAQAGLARLPQEGVQDFVARVLAARHGLAARLQPLAQQYLDLRYGPPAAEPAARSQAITAFLRAARAFRMPPGPADPPR